MSVHALHQPTKSDEFKHLHQLASEVGQVVYGTCHKKLYEIRSIVEDIHESSKGVRGFVEGHQHSHNRQRHQKNCTVFLEQSKGSRLVVVKRVESL